MVKGLVGFFFFDFHHLIIYSCGVPKNILKNGFVHIKKAKGVQNNIQAPLTFKKKKISHIGLQ